MLKTQVPHDQQQLRKRQNPLLRVNWTYIPPRLKRRNLRLPDGPYVRTWKSEKEIFVGRCYGVTRVHQVATLMSPLEVAPPLFPRTVGVSNDTVLLVCVYHVLHM
jgi:hypothetical protein